MFLTLLMHLIRIILLNLVIINVLLWINHEILHIFRFKKRVLAYSLGWWAIAALLMLAYAYISQFIAWERTIQSWHSLLSFLPIITLIFLAFIIIRNPWKKRYFNTILMTALTVIALYLIITYMWNNTLQITGGYFLLIAYAEENLKLIGVRNQANTLLIRKSDLILCWIISGLWFAFIESIAVSSSVIHSINRFPLFFIHAIFTSYIAYGFYKSEKDNQQRLSPLILVSVIAIHTLYNLWSSSFSTIIWIALWVATYLLYILIISQNDSLYYQKTTQ